MYQASRIDFCVQADSESNADLIIGTPEYNKLRYPKSPFEGSGKPSWKHTIERELKLKADRKWKYSRGSHGNVYHVASGFFSNDVSHCISLNLHLKTKSFEYLPKTGQIFLYGQYVASVRKDNNRLGSFTLRHINTKETRYRLSSLGVNLVSRKGKTYWKMKFPGDYLESVMADYGGEERLQQAFKSIFPKIGIKKSDDAGTLSDYPVYFVECELLTNVEYPIYQNEYYNLSHYCSTTYVSIPSDIFEYSRIRKGLQNEQLQLEFENEDEVTFESW